ncbi:DnaJ domain-containing protein [Kordiimonas aquimaris]|uniref:DnaJ domain-containing protein n=1 Tax=Kordiimonas aquimaris TaxID=707591 RepID=UPI0021D00F2E|nr:DnaJ domain-containing protein [Kordiimonas aquimaris]
MIGYLFIGLLLAGLLLLLLNWWANADVKSAKSGLLWGIVGVCVVLAMLLLATGRGLFAIFPAAFAAFRMFGPSILGRVLGNISNNGQSPTRGNKSMSKSEALEVLGLDEGADKETVNAAYRRLMGQVHPDKGGSDWMAAKLNDARKTLLGE